MKIHDRVIVLRTEERGEFVDVTRDGRLVVELDSGERRDFDAFDLELVAVAAPAG